MSIPMHLEQAKLPMNGEKQRRNDMNSRGTILLQTIVNKHCHYNCGLTNVRSTFMFPTSNLPRGPFQGQPRCFFILLKTSRDKISRFAKLSGKNYNNGKKHQNVKETMWQVTN